MSEKSLYALATGKETPIAVADNAPATAPYVQFVSVKSSKWGEYLQYHRDLRDGDPILIDGGKNPNRLQPMRFFLASAQQYWAIVNDENEIVRARFDRPEDRKYTEFVEAALLVFDGEGLTPALCTFRGPKTAAVLAATREITECTSVAWSKRSPDHALAIKLASDPRLRVVTTVSLQSRTSRTSGYKYVVANGTANPASAGDFQLLAAYLKDEGKQKQMTHVLSRYAERVNGVIAKSK